MYNDAAELILEEGHWQEFEHSVQRANKLEADLISYQWDGIVERFNHYCMKEGLYYSSHFEISEQEILIRLLARENRFYRRVLAEMLCGIIDTATDTEITTRYVKPRPSDRIAYVFMVFPHFEELTYKRYREERRFALQERCYIAKKRIPDIEHVIGIATESRHLRKEGRSEDIIHIDLTEWTQEDDTKVSELDKKRNLIKSLDLYFSHHDEYPIR